MQKQDYRLNSDFTFLAVLLVSTFLIYLPAMNSIVIFDDAQIISGRILRPDLLSSMPRLATHATYALIDQVFNRNLVAQKIFNFILHGLVVILLYFLTLRLIESVEVAGVDESSAKKGGVKNPVRVGVALFALNPSAVYATAYLVQRSILLATIFNLLMLRSFMIALQERKPLYLGSALLCYVLAVMSKELAAMAILLLPLIYIYLRKPTLQHSIAAIVLPLFITVIVAYFFLTHYHISLFSPYEPAATEYLARVGLSSPENSKTLLFLHLINQLNFFFVYGIFWITPNPGWMAIDLQPLFPLKEWVLGYLPLTFLFLLILATAIKAIFLDSVKTRLVGTLVLIPIVMFQTELLIVRVQEPFAIYRSYLWAISIPGLIALALAPLNRRQVIGAGIAAVALFGIITANRIRTFTSELTIWSDAIEKSSSTHLLKGFGAWRPYINRGAAYLGKGDIRHALEDFHRADSLGALHGVAQYNIGVVLQMLDQHNEALAALKNAESKNVRDPLLKYRIGESYYALQMFEKALKSYQEAASLSTSLDTNLLIATRRAEILVILKQFDDAHQIFSELMQSNPNDDRVHVGVAMANLGLGKIVLAQQEFETILKKSPNANAYYGLAMVHESRAQILKAQTLIDQAIALEPNNSSFTEYKAHLSQPQAFSETQVPEQQPTASATQPAVHRHR